MKIWAVEYSDYDDHATVSVWDNEEAADHHAAVLNEDGLNFHDVTEYEVGSVSTHRTVRWFEAYASWDVLAGFQTNCFPLSQVIAADDQQPVLPDHRVSRYRSQHPNPGYVKDTPNARIPDTPGGRYITTPAWDVTVRHADEDTAKSHAISMLTAALDADGVTP